jgi:hypothetical protein
MSFDLYLGQLFDHVDETLSTPFEDWCREQRIHPDAWGAWERYAAASQSQQRVAG